MDLTVAIKIIGWWWVSLYSLTKVGRNIGWNLFFCGLILALALVLLQQNIYIAFAAVYIIGGCTTYYSYTKPGVTNVAISTVCSGTLAGLLIAAIAR